MTMIKKIKKQFTYLKHWWHQKTVFTNRDYRSVHIYLGKKDD